MVNSARFFLHIFGFLIGQLARRARYTTGPLWALTTPIPNKEK